MGRKTNALAVHEEPEKSLTRPERLFHEINLLHLEGHYFTFDPKAASTMPDPMKSVEKRLQHPEINTVEPVEIIPHPGYGRPSVFAYKVFQSILKKLSDYGYPAPESVSFGHREILRLVGRDSYGGKESKELVRVLNQFRYTAINCWLYNKATGEAANLSLSLATTFLYTYKKRGQVSLFTLWLHPFLIKSINEQYTFCLNFARMQELEPITAAIFKHLYFHFSNIYSLKNSKDFTFRKDYAEICRTWLGGLKVLRYRAKILHEQLGRHLEALKTSGLIKKYQLEKNAGGNGFNLIFYPGPGFFSDYERFYRGRHQAELPFAFTADQNTIQKPQEIVLYFYGKLYGAGAVDELGFSEKETAFAASLIEKHNIEEVKGFIDFGLTEAKKTNFNIKTLGGLKKYYVPYTKYLVAQKRAQDQMSQRKAQEEQERLIASYDAYRHEELARIRAVLPTSEIEAIETSVRAELESLHPGSRIISSWIYERVNRVLVEKHKVLSFDEWQERCG
jgi:hypothetical protein